MWNYLVCFVLLASCWDITATLLYPLINPNKLYKYSPPEKDVTFFLYQENDLETANQIFINNEQSLDDSGFDPSIPTKILIHGWSHYKNVPWLIEMREVMAQKGNWNIIVVDWAPLSHVVYVEARVHTTVVSKQVANFITFLATSRNMSLSNLHLIGHSMGAQISAYASVKVRQKLHKKIGRISGLDPAAPLYEWPHIESLDEVLDPSDAIFVDVIHTNSGYLGMLTPAGHIDYFPNGGQVQPGCTSFSCSHIKACEFWTASMHNPGLFQAYSDNVWRDFMNGKVEEVQSIPMGIASNKHYPHGTYFLRTTGEEQRYIHTKTTIFDSQKSPE